MGWSPETKRTCRDGEQERGMEKSGAGVPFPCLRGFRVVCHVSVQCDFCFSV